MKKSLLVIVLIVLSATMSYSQVVDSNGEDDEDQFGGKYNVRTTLLIDYLGQSSNSMRGGRFNIEIEGTLSTRESNYPIGFNAFSVAVHHDARNTLKVSSNAIATLLALGAIGLMPKDTIKLFGYKNVIIGVLLVPVMIHALTNPYYTIKLINKNLDILVRINTDYFFFYGTPHVYSEATFGLRGRLKNFALSANLGIPFTQGYFENTNPYLGASASYYFDL